MRRCQGRDFGEPFGFAWWLSLFAGYLLFIVIGMGLYICLSPDSGPSYTPSTTESVTDHTTDTTSESDTEVPDYTTSASNTESNTDEANTNIPGTGTIQLVSLTSPVTPNGTAKITVQGTAGVIYDIDVFYSTTASTAKGLAPTEADEDGLVSWSWKVGGSVKPGQYRIEIRGGEDLLTVLFTVE